MLDELRILDSSSALTRPTKLRCGVCHRTLAEIQREHPINLGVKCPRCGRITFAFADQPSA